MLAHGFGCDQNLWRLVTARLAPEVPGGAVRPRRIGHSDPVGVGAGPLRPLQGYADDILDIVRELDLHDVVFVGHSVAAMIGVLAVAADPSRFAKLVLVTPSPRYLDDGDYRGGFSRADIDELLTRWRRNYLGWSRAMAPTIMGTDQTGRACTTNSPTASAGPIRPCARVFARTTFCPTTGPTWRGCTRPR